MKDLCHDSHFAHLFSSSSFVFVYHLVEQKLSVFVIAIITLDGNYIGDYRKVHIMYQIMKNKLKMKLY